MLYRGIPSQRKYGWSVGVKAMVIGVSVIVVTNDRPWLLKDESALSHDCQAS